METLRRAQFALILAAPVSIFNSFCILGAEREDVGIFKLLKSAHSITRMLPPSLACLWKFFLRTSGKHMATETSSKLPRFVSVSLDYFQSLDGYPISEAWKYKFDSDPKLRYRYLSG